MGVCARVCVSAHVHFPCNFRSEAWQVRPERPSSFRCVYKKSGNNAVIRQEPAPAALQEASNDASAIALRVRASPSREGEGPLWPRFSSTTRTQRVSHTGVFYVQALIQTLISTNTQVEATKIAEAIRVTTTSSLNKVRGHSTYKAETVPFLGNTWVMDIHHMTKCMWTLLLIGSFSYFSQTHC